MIRGAIRSRANSRTTDWIKACDSDKSKSMSPPTPGQGHPAPAYDMKSATARRADRLPEADTQRAGASVGRRGARQPESGHRAEFVRGAAGARDGQAAGARRARDR